jgi:beta propeller repeat protein
MYDLSNSRETRITTSGSAQSPEIYGDRIVWVDGNDIYMGTLSETIISEIEVSDNRLREVAPNKVYKSSPYIDVGGENSVRWRDVIGFDLSEYTGSTDVSNATLSLYWYYPADSTRSENTVIEIYRPASAWNPSYVSWNKRDKGTRWKNPGGDWYDKNGVLQGSTPYATLTIKGSSLPDNKYYELDVTDLVKEYTSGKYENTGFLIKARTESNNYIAFYSSDCGNTDQVPKLQLVYRQLKA